MNNPTVIITGASRGIGKAIATRFAESGFCLTLVSDAEKELEKAADGFANERVLLMCGDLANLTFTKEVVEQTWEKWGRIDVLVNNAAWRTIETMRTVSTETWDRTLRICLTAPAFLAKWSAFYMEKRERGVIINISSIMSERAAGTSPAYIVSKGALESLTYELATLYGPIGIRVVAVRPGNVVTQMSQDFTDERGVNVSVPLVEHMEDATPLQRSAMPEEIAEAVYWLSSRKASFITGTTLSIDGGFSHNFNSYSIKSIQFPNEF